MIRSRLLFHWGMGSCILALAGCGPSAPDESGNEPDATAQTPMPVEPDGGIGDGAGPPDISDGLSIPTAFHGEWGMNAADCEGGAAAKGLLTIDGTTLTFYESVGTLDDVEDSKPGSLTADYAFEGEGMEWTRGMRLELSDGGSKLERSELGDGAMPGTFTYDKCA